MARLPTTIHWGLKNVYSKTLTTKHHQQQMHSNEFTSMLEHSGKKGMRVIWIGMASNIGLTITKGVAGWVMNSASLLADATHSLSDLFSDFVTLYTFKMSRRPADHVYPYGYGKYETIGTLSVSALLLAAGIGIGIHSVDLLLSVMNESQLIAMTEATTATVNASLKTTPDPNFHEKLFDLKNNNGLDPNAAWFALGSVFVKEWLYRITLKIGKSERSDVLIANAWHHRSDAYTSLVALVAIGGSHMGLPILDPLGGIVVSGMILKSGMNILSQSAKELMDKGISQPELDIIRTVMEDFKNKENHSMEYHSIRGRKFGPFHHVDLVLELNEDTTLLEANKVKESIRKAIQEQCDYVQEVTIFVNTRKSLM